MHAATKILNGHSDTVAGALAVREPDAFWSRIVAGRKNGGAILGPFEAFLLIRGMRTLHLRAAAQARGAQELAERLSGHPHVARVLYPGMPRHPGHDVAARQMENGFGYMLSVQAAGGERAAVGDGGPGRLVEARDLPRRRREPDRAPRLHRGPGTPCPPDLLRLSTGIEDPDDLFRDLDAALSAAHA
jgi:cystathionine gamma-synthase